MPIQTSEDTLRAFAALPRSILEDIVEVARRLPQDWWADLLAELRMSEARKLPGSITQTLHHDTRGMVHGTNTVTERRRQRNGRG